MPKQKTKSAVKKRFKLTATGKIKRTKANKRHNLLCKSSKMKRKARGTKILSDTHYKTVKRHMHG